MRSVPACAFALWLAVPALAQDPTPASPAGAASPAVDRHGVPTSLNLDAVLESPGRRWTIDEIAKRAVEASPRVDIALARLDQAVATKQEVRSGVIPRVNLSANYTRLSPINNASLVPEDLVPEGIFIDVPRNRYNLRAVLRYPLSQLFLEILPAIRSSQNAEEAERYQSDVERNDVALQAIDIYMNHARARGELAVAELAVQQAEENRAQARARLRTGIGDRPDLLRFEARVAAAERGVAQSRAAVEATANALRTLLDLPGEGPFAFEERLTIVPPRTIDDQRQTLIENAWTERDEMLAANELVRSAEYGTRSLRGSMAPTIAVEAGADYARPNPLFIPPIDDFRSSWNLTAVAEWSPDGTYTASRAKRRAEAVEREVKAQREQLRDVIRIQVIDAYSSYEASFESVRAAKRQVIAADEAYQARRRGYELGVADSTEVIDAEVDVNRARLALIDAAAGLRIAESALRRAMGEHLWE